MKPTIWNAAASENVPDLDAIDMTLDATPSPESVADVMRRMNAALELQAVRNVPPGQVAREIMRGHIAEWLAYWEIPDPVPEALDELIDRLLRPNRAEDLRAAAERIVLRESAPTLDLG